MGEMLDLNAKTFDERRTIQCFLDWLNEQEMGIASYTKEELEKEYPRLSWISEGHIRLLDRYFKIDSAQLEKERRELLESVQQ